MIEDNLSVKFLIILAMSDDNRDTPFCMVHNDISNPPYKILYNTLFCANISERMTVLVWIERSKAKEEFLHYYFKNKPLSNSRKTKQIKWKSLNWISNDKTF